MTLNQMAQKAMDYLDSVGVAAEWEISKIYGCSDTLVIITDDRKYYSYKEKGYMDGMLQRLIREYPQKSPA